jgi:N-methylhydantoinase A
VEAVAVCFIFSFLRPDHERRTAAIIAEEVPGLRVSLSSSVLPVVREYIRLSTTAIDAYVGTVVERYLSRLDQRLRSCGVRTRRLYAMQSNGGLTPIATAGRHASQLLLSGPAAGLIASAELARNVGRPNVVTFDMGGTSADIGLVVDGQVRESAGGVLVGQDVGTPMLQVRTLSAGGGTIAWIGKDGLLKVGPSSAGSHPGPACYGLGGEAPTVTDANVVLGYLGSGKLAGSLSLDAERARAAIETHVARPLRLDVIAAAHGIRRIINTVMAGDVRLALQEAGQDPRRFSLMAFGGAGGLHASEIARSCGIPEVIVPLRPGLNCAMGLLQTSIRHGYLRSRLGRLSSFPADAVEETFRELTAEAMAEARAEGFEPHEVRLTRLVEMRYPNQGYQLAVPCPTPFSDQNRTILKADFDALHRRTYGQAAEAADAELVTFRLLSEVAVPRLKLPRLPTGSGDPCRALIGEREIYDPAASAVVHARVYDRDLLAPNDVIEGPAIVNQLDATTVLLAGQSLEVAPNGALLISTGAHDCHTNHRTSTRAGAKE